MTHLKIAATGAVLCDSLEPTLMSEMHQQCKEQGSEHQEGKVLTSPMNPRLGAPGKQHQQASMPVFGAPLRVGCSLTFGPVPGYFHIYL